METKVEYIPQEIERHDASAFAISGVVHRASSVYLMDCIKGMKQYPDKFFDWAIVDPPYGISITSSPRLNLDKGWSHKKWDEDIPSIDYFNELNRVSKNQIIWGWNYFSHLLPSCRGVICWDKMNHHDNYSAVEIAFCSKDSVAKKFTYMWDGNRYGTPGNIQGVGKKSIRIHPSEKPVALYEWLLENYTSDGDLILDTHLGSGSHRIAANKVGRDFVGFEIDREYFDKSNERFEKFIKQLRLFG